MSANMTFNELVEYRMKRFITLLDNAGLDHKQYQIEGVEKCLRNELRPNPPYGIRGGIIADEMGLGKTITIIGTMFVNYLQNTLIVLPPVLLLQWEEYIFNASGHRPLVYYGATKKAITMDHLRRAPIVLTTYNAVIPEKSLLKNMPWNRVVFDEAHHLRNSSTLRYKACFALDARVRWLVTGTPVQNSRKDFHSLCKILGMHKDFYSRAANRDFILNNFVMRRTKEDAGIMLPAVCVTHCEIPWKNKKEMAIAEELHAMVSGITGVSPAKAGEFGFSVAGDSVLRGMLRSRQSCIMPSLMMSVVAELVDNDKISPEYLEYIGHTSKIDAVVGLLLQRMYNGNGKIVFCHFQAEIDMIASRLIAGGMRKVVTYDGRNSGGKALKALADPADALIIQIQTGCEGLNLQANFSEIYFVSPHWNPAVHDQAIARCHRIGQKKEVNVFNFIMNGFAKTMDYESDNLVSMERYVSTTQTKKRQVIREVLEIDYSTDVEVVL
jgi:SNF2 family DNA or RNA helicase